GGRWTLAVLPMLAHRRQRLFGRNLAVMVGIGLVEHGERASHELGLGHGAILVDIATAGTKAASHHAAALPAMAANAKAMLIGTAATTPASVIRAISVAHPTPFPMARVGACSELCLADLAIPVGIERGE